MCINQEIESSLKTVQKNKLSTICEFSIINCKILKISNFQSSSTVTLGILASQLVLIACGHITRSRLDFRYKSSLLIAKQRQDSCPSSNGVEIIGFITNMRTRMRTHILRDAVYFSPTWAGFSERSTPSAKKWRRIYHSMTSMTIGSSGFSPSEFRFMCFIKFRILYKISGMFWRKDKIYMKICVCFIRFYWPLFAISGFVVPIWTFTYFFPELTWFQLFALNYAQLLIPMHLIFCVNSIAHRYGFRPWDK